MEERLIRYLIKEYRNENFYDDLYQDLILVSMKCKNIESKNPKSYLSTALRREMYRKVRFYTNVINTPKSVKIDVIDEGVEDIPFTPSNCFYHNLETAKKHLTTQQYEMLSLYCQGYTKVEIARMQGVTKQAIDDRFKTITKKLKNKWEEI